MSQLGRRRDVGSPLGRMMLGAALAFCSGWMLRAQQPPSAPQPAVMHQQNIPWTKGDPARFVGQVDTQPMPLPPGSVRVSRVRHEAGAYTNWHVHVGGQVLYAETGRGRVQKAGGALEEFGPGDIVYTAPGEKHWHGATPDSPMTLVAMSIGDTQWLERVLAQNVEAPVMPTLRMTLDAALRQLAVAADGVPGADVSR
jgi:quercetin dioxygenase-like cupin family protein